MTKHSKVKVASSSIRGRVRTPTQSSSSYTHCTLVDYESQDPVAQKILHKKYFIVKDSLFKSNKHILLGNEHLNIAGVWSDQANLS